jgi:hypothetical protein
MDLVGSILKTPPRMRPETMEGLDSGREGTLALRLFGVHTHTHMGYWTREIQAQTSLFVFDKGPWKGCLT